MALNLTKSYILKFNIYNNNNNSDIKNYKLSIRDNTCQNITILTKYYYYSLILLFTIFVRMFVTAQR